MELVDTFVGKMWLFDNEDEISSDPAIRKSMGYFVSNKIRVGYEKESLRIVENYLKPDMTCIDVGASVGLYSVFAAQRIGNGVVYAFEPNDKIYPVLQKNSELYSNILPHCLGLHEKTGQYVYRPNKAAKYELPIVIGDEFLQDVKKVDFIKIDVDGAEPGVIRGLSKLIKRSPKLLMICEFGLYYMKAGYSPEEFFDMIGELGFEYGRIQKNHIEVVDRKQLELECPEIVANNLLLWKGIEPFWFEENSK